MTMSIWGFPVQAAYLPWVLLLLNVVQGQDPISDLIGIATGHAYIYVKTVLPNSHGYRIIEKMNPKSESIINFIDRMWNKFFPENRPRNNIYSQDGRVSGS